MMKRAPITLCLLALLALLATPMAHANVLVTDLSKDQISIRGDFAGETLLLFGAIDPAPHGVVDGVVVILRGPGENITLRKKQKTLGIWVNQAAYPMGPLPGFLAVVSSAPLVDLIPDEERRLLNIGADKLQANMLRGTPTDEEQRAALAAFIRLKQKDRLFAEMLKRLRLSMTDCFAPR